MAGNEITVSDVLKSRNDTYQLLERLFAKEVDQPLLDKLCVMRFPQHTGNAKVDEGYDLIRNYLSHIDSNALTTLAVDYVRTFIGSGVSGYSAAYPYESVYTSPKRLMMQDARDEVLALYRAAGLDKSDNWKESEDHIAAELEFMCILGTRAVGQLDAGDEDAAIALLVQQKNFLEDHLLAWYPMMEEDMEKFPKTDFYRGLGKLTMGYLENDAEFLADILADTGYEDESAQARDAARSGANGAGSVETESVATAEVA